MFELTGKVKKIFEEQTFGSGFNKREFVITVEDGKYPQDIVMETVKEKTALVDELGVGETVTVAFDIRGREWKERFFVNLNAWKITKGEASGSSNEASNGGDGGDVQFEKLDESEDVPF